MDCKINTESNGIVRLVQMERELLHLYFKGFENDPDIFMDMSRFKEFCYSPEWVDAYYRKQMDDAVPPFPRRYPFMIMMDATPIGELYLKRVDYQKQECVLSIHLQNDSVKNKGYGTAAERLALDYAFNTLGMNTVLADCIHKNIRSRHVLEKLGFEYMAQDESFRYYRYSRQAWDLQKPYAY